MSSANFLILANVFLGGYVAQPHEHKEGGIQVLADLAPFSQTVESLLRTLWPEKPARKK